MANGYCGGMLGGERYAMLEQEPPPPGVVISVVTMIVVAVLFLLTLGAALIPVSFLLP